MNLKNLFANLSSLLINITCDNKNYEKQAKDNYDIIIYKNKDCPGDLKNSENNKEIPIIDFGDCYEKIKKENNIDEDEELIVSKIEVKNEIDSRKSSGYAFYHPYTLQKLDSSSCENQAILVKEDFSEKLDSKLKNNNQKEFIYDLIDQGINILDNSDEFYRDLCYHYKSKNGKDIPLKVRLTFIPNITLCESRCENVGVDLEHRRAKCECKFKDIVSMNIMGDNLYTQAFNDALDVISELNVAVVKCIKDIFNKDKFIKCTGGFIILFLFLGQIICLIIYAKDGLYYIRKHLMNLTQSYLDYIDIKSSNQNLIDLKNNNKNPPKKKFNNIRKSMIDKDSSSQLNKKGPNSSSKRKIIDNLLDKKKI